MVTKTHSAAKSGNRFQWRLAVFSPGRFEATASRPPAFSQDDVETEHDSEASRQQEKMAQLPAVRPENVDRPVPPPLPTMHDR